MSIDLPGATAPITEKTIMEALSRVYDPEIPVNIVELGLIYGVKIDNGNVAIDVTMTAPACPAADQVVADCQARTREVAGVKAVDVRVVWDPPWTPDRMSEAAKLELGMAF